MKNIVEDTQDYNIEVSMFTFEKINKQFKIH